MVLRQRPSSSCSLSRAPGKNLETDVNSDDEWENDSDNHLEIDVKPIQNGQSSYFYDTITNVTIKKLYYDNKTC